MVYRTDGSTSRCSLITDDGYVVRTADSNINGSVRRKHATAQRRHCTVMSLCIGASFIAHLVGHLRSGPRLVTCESDSQEYPSTSV